MTPTERENCRVLAGKGANDIDIVADLKNPNTVNRFLKFVGPLSPTGCRLWSGTHHSAGYGVFHLSKEFGGKPVRAHRVAWVLAGKQLINGLELDHVCRNRGCVHVDPDHLEQVTTRENVRRGIGPTAINSRKVQCPAGHPYNEQNLYTAKSGKSHCRVCAKARTFKARSNAALALAKEVRR